MSSSIVLSLSSNCLSLHSLHRHHIRQQGTIFHTTALRERPPVHQQAKRSITRRVITQEKLKRLKMAFQRTQAASQWRRRWSTDSLFFLHIQHLSITMSRLFLRLSNVRIFPSTAAQAKKDHFQGNLGTPNTFPREMTCLLKGKRLIERSNIKLTFARRRPPKLIFPITI
jgi:hypothetical protein